MEKIHFGRKSHAEGRNGTMKCTGLVIYQSYNNKDILISPINTKGIGRGHIGIPKESAMSLIHAIAKAAGDVSVPTVWCVEDVEERATDDEENLYDCEITFARTKFEELLRDMERKHDCNFGTTWDTISALLDDYKIADHYDDPYDYFVEWYKPIEHSPDAPWSGTMLETYGEDLEKVKEVDPNHVWTMVEGESGDTYAIAGYRTVNRLGYFVTERPWEHENVQFKINEEILQS